MLDTSIEIDPFEFSDVCKSNISTPKQNVLRKRDSDDFDLSAKENKYVSKRNYNVTTARVHINKRNW